jgi:translation initiation factor IF-1
MVNACLASALHLEYNHNTTGQTPGALDERMRCLPCDIVAVHIRRHDNMYGGSIRKRET